MKIKEILSEKWSEKYKRSINCSNPKGFSQKAHCAGRKKNEEWDDDDDEEGDVMRLHDHLSYPEIVDRISGMMRAMGWKVRRKGDDDYIFLIRGQLEDEWYTVSIGKTADGKGFTYALGTIEEGDPHIGQQEAMPNTVASVSMLADEIRDGFGMNENFADGTLNEYRNALYDFVKSKFPTWPEYVLKDFLYAQAKGIRDKEELKDFLDRNQKDYGQVKWRLDKLFITLDIFTPKTQQMIIQREGGSSNPSKVPRDAERHALQAKIIQQKGVSPEPIIVAKLSNGYDLIEGWHRTIQHLKRYPEGYTGPAWVAYGATYTSEDVAENFADGKKKGKSRPGRVKKAGASCKGSVTDLRARAKKYGGEKGKMYHWCANMKSGRNK